MRPTARRSGQLYTMSRESIHSLPPVRSLAAFLRLDPSLRRPLALPVAAPSSYA